MPDAAPLAGVVALVAGPADASAALRARAAALGARASARLAGTTTHIIFCRGGGAGRGAADADLRALHDRVALVRERERGARAASRALPIAPLSHSQSPLLSVTLASSPFTTGRRLGRPRHTRLARRLLPGEGAGGGKDWGRERGVPGARKTLERAVEGGGGHTGVDLLSLFNSAPSLLSDYRKPRSSSPSRPAWPP